MPPVNYPLIGDHDLAVAKLYDMLPADAGTTSQGRTAATNQTVRTVYLVGPDKLIKALLVYPMSSGRNFDEVLRLLDSMQLTAEYKVATPVNWKQGEDVIIVPSVSDEEAKQRFPQGLEDREVVSARRASAQEAITAAFGTSSTACRLLTRIGIRITSTPQPSLSPTSCRRCPHYASYWHLRVSILRVPHRGLTREMQMTRTARFTTVLACCCLPLSLRCR